MKRLLTLVALMCAVTFQTNAQTKAEQLLKDAEAKCKVADKKLKDWKAQYDAAFALGDDSLLENRDYDRALVYANRALQLAQAQTVLKDTMLAKSYMIVAQCYLAKDRPENWIDFTELAIEAYEKELGRYNSFTLRTKFLLGNSLIMKDPRRGFLLLQQAFYDNEQAPANQRLININKAELSLCMSLEFLMAEYTQRLRYVLPTCLFKGEHYTVLQFGSWNIGKPFMNWLTPTLLEEKRDPRDYILMDSDGKLISIPVPENLDDKENRPEMNYNFKYNDVNPRLLEDTPDLTPIKNFQPDAYNDILRKYNEFIKK